MKVVLFCGGMGMRMREYSENVPKPMVPIGSRPIIWHIMKYYAHFGHKDFILCLGYKGETIKEYFLNYRETLTNDFVLTEGGRKVDLITSDIHDWRITFVDTGLKSNLGMRLMNVRQHLEGEDVFMAHYTDILTDLDLAGYVNNFLEHKQDKVASFVAARPPVSFHTADVDEHGNVSRIGPAATSDLWQNGGFFILRRELFDFMEYGDELVEQPFQRLLQQGKLVSHKHHGFWSSMDTYKEMQALNEIETSGKAPWMLWRNGNGHHK